MTRQWLGVVCGWHRLCGLYYRIAGNFGGQNIRGSAILRHFVGNIFVVAACTAGKGISKVASFVGKIFVVRPLTTKTINILPHESYPL